MCLRYSSRVVAPIQRNSPRANMGFSKLAASMLLSLEPVPTTVCNSSINRTICPSDLVTSSSTVLRRFSKSPLYLAPAIRLPISREINWRFLSDSGTSPLTMRWAKPSAIAVFPTPGSPIKTGLFFERRDNT